jgi:2-polyprenyl-3-methyl-5-hydroxy-6-metoxy-1,4-benzoquinol methylase
VSQPSSAWESAVEWLRSQPDQQDLVLNAYYDDPLIEAARRYWESGEWKEIRKLLGRTRGRALDVGAGRGVASYALAREGFTVTALEPDGGHLVGAGAIRLLAQENGLPITVVQEFSEQLPFGDCQFEVVFARAVLHHTRNLHAALREFFRVLKPGGRLIAVREHVISRKKDLPVFLSRHPLHRLYGGEHAFLLAEYREAMAQAGFATESVLSPLKSVINYAPYTEESLKDAIADRFGALAMKGVLRQVLGLPALWSLASKTLSSVDHRPGRLYSFVCTRP